LCIVLFNHYWFHCSCCCHHATCISSSLYCWFIFCKYNMNCMNHCSCYKDVDDITPQFPSINVKLTSREIFQTMWNFVMLHEYQMSLVYDLMYGIKRLGGNKVYDLVHTFFDAIIWWFQMDQTF
jgi:hypothetical protein